MHVFAVGRSCPAGLIEELTLADDLNCQIDIVRPLLCTSSCSVNVVRAKRSGLTCVIKSYSNWRLNDAGRRQVDREIALHQRLDHPHVVKFWLAFDDGTQRHIVMEYCNKGTLRHAMQRLTEQQLCQCLAVPLLQVLVQLEELGVVHRDLKPENIFLGEDSMVKLGDFGLAVFEPGALKGPLPQPGSPLGPAAARLAQQPLRRGSSGLSSSGCGGSTCGASSTSPCCGCEASSVASDSISALEMDLSSCRGELGPSGEELQLQAGGTPAYTAPEVVLAAFNGTRMEEAVSCKNDVWALGVVLLELLHGHHPYAPPDASSGEVMCTVASGKAIKFPHSGLSPALRSFLSAALAMDPNARATAHELLHHAWVREGAAAAAGTLAAAAAPAASAAQVCSGGGVPKGAAGRVSPVLGSEGPIYPLLSTSVAAWPLEGSRGSSPRGGGSSCHPAGGSSSSLSKLLWGGWQPEPFPKLRVEPFPRYRRSRSCSRSCGSGKGPLGFMQGLDCWEY